VRGRGGGSKVGGRDKLARRCRGGRGKSWKSSVDKRCGLSRVQNYHPSRTTVYNMRKTGGEQLREKKEWNPRLHEQDYGKDEVKSSIIEKCLDNGSENIEKERRARKKKDQICTITLTNFQKKRNKKAGSA